MSKCGGEPYGGMTCRIEILIPKLSNHYTSEKNALAIMILDLCNYR